MNRNSDFHGRLRSAVAASRYANSQKDLAEALEMREASVSAWLRQKAPATPKAETIFRLADTLGVSRYWLLDGKGPMRPESDPVEIEAFREMAAIVDRVRATPPASGASSLAEAETTARAEEVAREARRLAESDGPQSEETDDGEQEA